MGPFKGQNLILTPLLTIRGGLSTPILYGLGLMLWYLPIKV